MIRRELGVKELEVKDTAGMAWWLKAREMKSTRGKRIPSARGKESSNLHTISGLSVAHSGRSSLTSKDGINPHMRPEHETNSTRKE